MQSNIPNEILEYVNKKGILERIAETQQAEREEERVRLAEEIIAIKKHEAEILPPILDRQRKARADIEAAEAALQQARVELAEADSQIAAANIGFRIQASHYRLAMLADPRIHGTITQLLNFDEKARQGGFSAWTQTEKKWDGDKTKIECNNSDVLEAIRAQIRKAVTDLEALLYAPRPANLAEILEAALSAGEAACHRVGVTVHRADHPASITKH